MIQLATDQLNHSRSFPLITPRKSITSQISQEQKIASLQSSEQTAIQTQPILLLQKAVLLCSITTYMFWTHFPAVSICRKRYTHAVMSSEKDNFGWLQNQFSPLIITKVIPVQHLKCSQIITQWSAYWQASVYTCDCSNCWQTDVLQYLVWDLPWQTSGVDCGSFIHKLV